jgi:hypothetical protein
MVTKFLPQFSNLKEPLKVDFKLVCFKILKTRPAFKLDLKQGKFIVGFHCTLNVKVAFKCYQIRGETCYDWLSDVSSELM